MSTRGIIQGAARPHALRHGPLCRTRRSARYRHADLPARRAAGVYLDFWSSGYQAIDD